MAEPIQSNNYRRRHRKELAFEEIEVIIELSEKQYWSHADIAKKMRISETLVGRLVRQSIKQPMKIQRVEEREAMEIELE